MNIEQQVTSLELAKQLKEAGYPQDESLFMWDWEGKLRVGINGVNTPHYKTAYPDTLKIETDECFAAPTVAELGEKLPRTLYLDDEVRGKGAYEIYLFWPDRGGDWWLTYEKEEDFRRVFLLDGSNAQEIHIKDKNEANARAKMWLYLKKENLL